MNRSNEPLVSPATFWEIAIKVSIGKYEVEEELVPFFTKLIAENGMVLLPITIEHAAAVADLPHHHRDPFDRLLVAQAISEGIPIISTDRALDAYSVERIW
jgi:PIN domain nuclease of toxin-antitoxin system